MKLDVFKNRERYENWKAEVLESGVSGVNKKNSDRIKQYIFDMEAGINISSKNKKGARSYPTLNKLRQRIIQMARMLEERGIKDITQIDEKKLVKFFGEIRDGSIKNSKGERYNSVGDYTKVFTAFWHWWMKVNRKEGKQIIDITEDLDKSRNEGSFVYITKEQLEEAMPYFDQDEQVMLMFVFDSIIRSPTELLSLKRKDVYRKDGHVWVHVDGTIAKTGRNGERDFNLLYCGDELLKYIERNNLEDDDPLFNNNHTSITSKMQRVFVKLFGDRISHPKAGGNYKNIRLYDLRHSGAISLRIIASKGGKISLDKLRQRGGWIDFDMINYYTKFIGLDGEISKEALLLDEDKSRIEKNVDKVNTRLQAVVDLIMNNPNAVKALAKDKEKLQKIMALE